MTNRVKGIVNRFPVKRCGTSTRHGANGDANTGTLYASLGLVNHHRMVIEPRLEKTVSRTTEFRNPLVSHWHTWRNDSFRQFERREE